METAKSFTLYDEIGLSPGLKTSEIFARSVLEFERACRVYKSILDKNYGRRFCINSHCKTIFMVEIMMTNGQWGTTPKVFQSEEEAQGEIAALKQKYAFLTECRVITRKIEENN